MEKPDGGPHLSSVYHAIDIRYGHNPDLARQLRLQAFDRILGCRGVKDDIVSGNPNSEPDQDGFFIGG